MDPLFLWISIFSMALIVTIYMVTKGSRLKAHEKVKAKNLPWTRVPATTLSIGAALVLLGIVFDIENQIINYILIGVGDLISVIELIKIKSDDKSSSEK